MIFLRSIEWLIVACPNRWREGKRNNRDIRSVVAVADPASIGEKRKFCSLFCPRQVGWAQLQHDPQLFSLLFTSCICFRPAKVLLSPWTVDSALPCCIADHETESWVCSVTHELQR
jgi:hypothetical protein